MPQIETCINTLQAPADQLLKEGVDPPFIMAALAEIIVDLAKTDRHFDTTHLESVAAILKANEEAIRGGTVMNMAKAIFG
jgi:hypothetical protein